MARAVFVLGAAALFGGMAVMLYHVTLQTLFGTGLDASLLPYVALVMVWGAFVALIAVLVGSLTV